jgi:plastocyanin
MRAITLALAAVLAFPVAAQASAGARSAATANVEVGDFFFRPAYTRIEPGDTVTWRIAGGGPHTATSRPAAPAAFDSGELLSGQEFSFTFAAAGRYPYLCSLHDFMRGVVQVGPDTVDPKLSKLVATVRASRVWVAFTLAETSKVSASVATVKRPRKKLRRIRAKTVEEGRRSLSVKIGGLKPGRYRVTLTARDPEGNARSVKAPFKIPKPKP